MRGGGRGGCQQPSISRPQALRVGTNIGYVAKFTSHTCARNGGGAAVSMPSIDPFLSTYWCSSTFSSGRSLTRRRWTTLSSSRTWSQKEQGSIPEGIHSDRWVCGGKGCMRVSRMVEGVDEICDLRGDFV